MANEKLLAPPLAKAARKPAAHGDLPTASQVAQVDRDPERIRAELAIGALSASGFETRDKLAQIPSGVDAVLALQQLAGNQFVTNVLLGSPDLLPVATKPEPTSESKDTKNKDRKPTNAADTQPGPPKRESRATDSDADQGTKTIQQTDKSAKPDGKLLGSDTDSKRAPDSQQVGAKSFPLPPAQNARRVLKVAEPTASGSADGGGNAGDPVRAWQKRVTNAAATIPTKHISSGKGAVLSDVGAKVVTKSNQAKDNLPEDGAKAITPPKQPKDLPAIPEDVSTVAFQMVDDKSAEKLKPTTLPPLVPSPLNRIPEIGRELPPKVQPGALKDPVLPKPPQEADQKSSLVKEPATEPKKLAVEGVTVEDQAPSSEEIPAGQMVDIGTVVARLLAQKATYAKKIVDEARGVAYDGQIMTWTELGKDFEKDEVSVVDDELHRVADAAGIGKEALDKKIQECRDELNASKKKAEDDLNKAAEAAHKTQTAAGNEFLDTVNSTRKWLDQISEARAVSVKGGVDPKKLHKERDDLIAKVNQKAARGKVNYDTAAARFKDVLDTEANKQIHAYGVAAAEEQNQLQLEASKRAGDDPKKQQSESAAASVAFRATKYWRDDQIAAVRKFVEIEKVGIDSQIAGFESHLEEAAVQAREKIRDWTERRLGQERGILERLLDWISDWLSKAHDESEAWAHHRAAENKAAVEQDNQFLDAELGRLSKMTKEEVSKEFSKLSDEQFAVIRTYFESGGDRMEAMAAGLVAHISAQRRPEILKKFEKEILLSKDLVKVTALATSQSPGFDPILRSDGLRKAFAGVGTDEEAVFANLSGLTAVQAHAVELQYESDWHEDLRSRLNSELDDWLTWSKHDINRANALMAGDAALATAIQLNQAMHGNWNGLDLGGTDEDSIFLAMRNKSPAEVAAIKKAYLQTYGVPLETEFKEELDDALSGHHDYDRAKALLASDTLRADTIAVDKAMHGTWWGLGIGTDRGAIEQVYKQMDAELGQEAEAKGWDSAKLKLEKSNRRKALDKQYEDLYGADWTNKRKPGQTSLGAAYNDDLSGAELRLIEGLHEQSDAKANSARIRIEHESIIYADDKVINSSIQAAYNREYNDKKRDLNLAIDEQLESAKREAQLKNDPGAFDKAYPPEKIREMRKQAAREADGYARATCKTEFRALEKDYNTNYQTNVFELGFRKDVDMGTQGADNEKANKLMMQEGSLTDVQEIRYAIQGLGTGDEARANIINNNLKETNDLKKRWLEDPDNKGLGTLDDYVLDDYSGRDYHEIKDALDFGLPETPSEKLAKAKRDLVFEENSNNRWSNQELEVLRLRVATLQREVDEFNAYAANKDKKDFDWTKYAQLQGAVDAKSGYVDSAVSVHRKEVDVVTDAAVQAIGAAVTAVIVAASILADVGTAGGAAAATPAEAAAVGAIWTALGISAAGTVVTISAKAWLKGDAYGWEEAGEDLGIGVVDALISLPTGGVGGKLLKGGTMLGKLAEKKLFGKILANFLAHAAEGSLQAAPGAFLSNLLNKENYQGNAILNVLEGTVLQTAGAAALSGGVGMLHIALQTDLVKVRTNPEYQAKVFERFRANNPDKSYEQFLSNLDGLILARTEKGFKDPRLQEDLHSRLAEHLPSDQKKRFASVPIEVLSEDKFKLFTGSDSGKAVTIFRNGKPVIVMKAGAKALELSAESFHLLQATEAANAPQIAKLDESHLKNWTKLDIDKQFDLYGTKLELEIDANQRMLKSLEENRKTASNPVEVAVEIEKTKANLENLRKRQAEVAAVTPDQKIEMTKTKQRPAYLDDPPRLFSKDPTIPKAVPRVDPPSRPIEDVRREYGALKSAEARGPLDHEQYIRLQTLENELKTFYVPTEESMKLTEARLFGQRPGESLEAYRKRLESLRPEVELGGNADIWVHYEELLPRLDKEVADLASLRKDLKVAEEKFRKASRQETRQRQALRDPRVKISPDEPYVLRKDVEELFSDMRELQTKIKGLESRGAARSQAYEFSDIGKLDPCFVPGTLVSSPHGARAIESFRVGELVLAYDWRTEQPVPRAIVAVTCSATDQLVQMFLGGSEILATRRHPFWLENQEEWCAAASLSKGDILRTRSGPVQLDRIAIHAMDSPTVSLEVGELHNFFVGQAQVLVHNGTPRPNFDDPVKRANRIYRIIETLPDGSERVIYIGKTRQTIQERFKDHLAQKEHWRTLFEQKRLRTELEEQGMWTEFETAVWEKHKIDEYRGKGIELENDAEPIVKETFDRLKRFFNGC